ncbi:MAG: metallophosphoesterase [Muribaculaceae bacterium]|nr:metallophosphoesterase [Muribaculaceae bacterium]
MRIPILFALTLLVLSMATDLYIYLDIRRNFRSRGWSRFYGWSAILCWIFLIITLLLPRRDADRGIEFQMWGFYSYLSVYVPKIIFTIASIIGGIPRILNGHSWKSGKWIGIPLAFVAFIAMWWGALFTRNQMEVVDVTIASARIPKGFDGYRIVQISDLHVGTWGRDTRFISRLCDSINSLKPDIILFTGDIVNRETTELQPFLKALSGLKAKDGVYSVLGNHDYGDYVEWPTAAEKAANLQLLRNWQRQIGWHLLDNDHTEIIASGDTIQLIGVENWGEPPFHQYGHLIDAYPLTQDSVKNLNDNRFKILMTHNPEHWLREVTDISNIDLTLSGHTHAMQTELRLGNWKWSPSAFRYKTWGGLYTRAAADGNNMKLYVNIGAGEVGMPFRIGAIPEITLITLRSGEETKSSPAINI